MEVKLIALYSPVMGSGKTEIANRLVEEHGFSLVKFAGPLKTMARGLFTGMGLDDKTIDRMIEGDLKETAIPGLRDATPRHIMQTLGTEWGREVIQSDLWVKVAMKRAGSIIQMGGRVVIDDLRFGNEFIAVQDFPQAMTVRVHRPDAVAYAKHPSEGLLEGYDFNAVIINDEDLDMLHRAADFFVKAVEAGVTGLPEITS